MAESSNSIEMFYRLDSTIKKFTFPALQSAREETPVPANPATPLAPYFICKSANDEKLFNALGLLGATLLADDSNYSNQISGFLTLFSLMTEEVPGSADGIVYLGWRCNPQPIAVYSTQSLYSKIKFLHPQTNAIFQNIIQAKAMGCEDGISIQSNVDFHEELRNINSLNFLKHYTVAMCGMAYLMMFNYVDEARFNSWVTNKWNMFARILTISKPIPNHSVFSALKSCIPFQEELGKFHSKRQLFEIIRKINDTQGTWSSVCGLIMQLTKYSQMGHIRLINKYIFVENPVIILDYKARPEVLRIMGLLDKLQKKNIASSDLPYYRILYDDDIANGFVRRFYPNLWYLANKVRFGDNIPRNVTFVNKEGTAFAHNVLDQCIVEAFEMKRASATGNKKARLLHQQAELVLGSARKTLNMLADPFTEDSDVIAPRLF